LTKPGLSVGGVGVEAQGRDAQSGELASIGIGQGSCAFPVTACQSTLLSSCHSGLPYSTWSCLRAAWLCKCAWE
jgi:hypothetical protein